MTALRFDNVTIRLGRRDILSAASFEIRDGEFVGMLGANGAGKTTLMRAALGLIAVESGAIGVLGEPVARGNAAVGYMPQNRAAIAGLRLTGWDVVASAAIGRRFGFVRLDRKIRREIDWALDEVGARDLAQRSIGELSGGERQKVLLSQALLGRPRLLLLDEPSLGLAPLVVKQIFEVIADLNKSEGLTVFLVEQNAFHALKLAHRGYVMVNGAITMQGAGAELLARPEVRAAYLEGGH